jgi:hypothetical protein
MILARIQRRLEPMSYYRSKTTDFIGLFNGFYKVGRIVGQMKIKVNKAR